MITLPLPLFFAACLLVLLFWLEILRKRRVGSVASLQKLRWPFYVIAGYLVVAEIALALARAFFFGSLATLISIVSILFVDFLVVIVVFVVIFKIRRHTHGSLVINSRVDRMNKHMIATAVSGIVLAIVLAIHSSQRLQSPFGGMTIIGIIALCIIALAANQIAMFRSTGKNATSIVRNSTGTHSKHTGAAFSVADTVPASAPSGEVATVNQVELRSTSTSSQESDSSTLQSTVKSSISSRSVD